MRLVVSLRNLPVVLTAVAVSAAVLGACASDGRELRPPTYPLPDPPVITEPVITEPAGGDAEPILPVEDDEVEESADSPGATGSGGRVTIDRLFSPANATAELVGTGAAIGDGVTVDDAPADILEFDVASDGSFAVQVWIPDEGAHTVCVAEECGRVYTLAPDAETSEEVIAKIEEALPRAEAILPYGDLFPDWTVEIGGALSGTGGSTDVATQTVFVYRNRGRTVDEFVRTILHEFGHVTDYERLTDDERTRFLELRGVEAGTIWREDRAHRLDDWGLQPSEDFAEAMVMFWTDGLYEPRTAISEAPDPVALAEIAQLAEFG